MAVRNRLSEVPAAPGGGMSPASSKPDPSHPYKYISGIPSRWGYHIYKTCEPGWGLRGIISYPKPERRPLACRLLQTYVPSFSSLVRGIKYGIDIYNLLFLSPCPTPPLLRGIEAFRFVPLIERNSRYARRSPQVVGLPRSPPEAVPRYWPHQHACLAGRRQTRLFSGPRCPFHPCRPLSTLGACIPGLGVHIQRSNRHQSGAVQGTQTALSSSEIPSASPETRSRIPTADRTSKWAVRREEVG